MKSSIYNTIFNVGPNKWLIYNSLSDRFIYVCNPIDTLLPETLEAADCSYKSSLIDNGFLVNESVDEVRLLRERLDGLMCDDTVYELHINPTLDCNLNCWYCYENHIKGSTVSDENLEKILRLVERICSKVGLEHLFISFFGGEPLLRFGRVVKSIMMEADKICKEKGVSLHFHFTTNGSLLTDRMIDFFKKKDVRFQITLDGDKEHHNQVRHFKGGVGTYDKIVTNIVKLTQAGCDVTLRINYTNENIGSVGLALQHIASLSDLKKERMRIDLQRVWQDTTNGKDDTCDMETIERMLKEVGIKYSCAKKRNMALQICYGDKTNYALINYNGDVFKCTARDFKSDKRIGVITENGEIEWCHERLQMWHEAKFLNAQCQVCKIAPICGGACRQKILEIGSFDKCLLGFDKEKINDIILDKFLDYAERNS